MASAAAMANHGSSEDLSDNESSGQRRANSKSGGLASAGKTTKLGHRRVDEGGQVSYKKIATDHLMHSLQLGIRYSIGVMIKEAERDLLMQDFMTIETMHFPRAGSSTTPAHATSDFVFRTYAPLAFRYFLNLFGVNRDAFMASLCDEPLRELSNPGASGSIFYLTRDDEFILKTVMHKESEFLQKLLPGYYMNLNQNPHTLLPKFFGMFCYQCNQKNIRLTVMNNLLPSNVRMHLRFDLKGSTYKRKASKNERTKSSPTFKDLDFMEMLPEGLFLEPETYNALVTTLRRDCRVLESFRIMDYSLLVGVHNLDQAAREAAENNKDAEDHLQQQENMSKTATAVAAAVATAASTTAPKTKLVAHSTAMEAIQAQTEPIDEEEHLPPGGIPARNHKGERLLLYLGIIDILQSYRLRKKLEHSLKSIIHDGDTVSVHRPGFYAHRFLDFMSDRVFKRIPSLDLPEIKGAHRKFRTLVSSLIAIRHSPSRRSKRDSVRKQSVDDKEKKDAGDNVAIPAAATTTSSTTTTTATTAATTSPTAPVGNVDNGEESHLPAVLRTRPSLRHASVPQQQRNNAVHRGVSAPFQTTPDSGSRAVASKPRTQGDTKRILAESDPSGEGSRLSTPKFSGVGWSSATPSWTHETDSFTESSTSYDHVGHSRSPSSSRVTKSETTRRYKGSPFHETEITRL